MKVLAVGGSGGMGRYAVRAAMELKGVEKMVVADLHATAARDFAASLGGNAEGVGLDVTDGEALRSALREADVVLNTVGPFFKFGPPVLRAAIECGCHYLDICDDWEPTLEMLEMDAAAREADVSAVIGLGASPGLTNMLALVAMRELDTVDSVYTGWNIGSAIPEEESSQTSVNAAMEHAIQQLTGTVRVQRNGAVEMVRPLEKVRVNYPGVGEREVQIFGHPEAVTFPHHHPQLRTSLNVAHGLGGDERFIRVMRWFIEHGWISVSRGARLLGWLEAQGTPPTAADLLNADRLPPIYGLAVGTKDGQAASVAAAFAEIGDTGMGYATGVPLACGLELLLDKVITQRGVFAPEAGAIDPHAFFTALGARVSRGLEHVEAGGLLVTRSWEPDVRARYAAAMARARAAG